MIFWDLRHASEQPALLSGELPPGLLSAPEQVFYHRLRTPRRQQEWLVGRWATKSLCQAWLARDGQKLPYTAITVAAAPDGSPYVIVAGQGPLPITVSLSHRDWSVACVLTEQPHAPLGVDLELCETRHPGFVEDFFTAGESALVKRAGDPCRATTEIWSMKEAALKALRLGLTVDTRRVRTNPGSTVVSCGPQGCSSSSPKWSADEQGWKRAVVEIDLPGKYSTGTALVRDFEQMVFSVVWVGPINEATVLTRLSSMQSAGN